METQPLERRSLGVRRFEAGFGFALGTVPGAIVAVIAADFFGTANTPTLIAGLMLGAVIGGWVGWPYGDGKVFDVLYALWP